MMSATNLLTFGLATPVIVFLVRYLLWPKPIPGIPHNEIKSFWGDMITMGQSFKKTGANIPYFFEPAAKRLGPIFQIVVGPFMNIVVITDAQEIEDILLRRTKLLEKSSVPRAITKGIVPHSQEPMETNDQWRRHRRIVGPAMTPKYLSQMVPSISMNIHQLIQLWKEKVRVLGDQGGSCFESIGDFRSCTMDIMGDIVYGQSFDGIKNALNDLPNVPAILDSHQAASFPLTTETRLQNCARILIDSIRFDLPPFSGPIYWFIQSMTPRWAKARNELWAFMSNRLAASRKRANILRESGLQVDSARCILDMIVEREGKDDKHPLSDEEIRDELLGLVLAGQDTTSSSLAFGVKYLTNHPRVQRKLRDELLANLEDPSNRFLTYEDVMSDKTPYLDAVTAEILRCAEVASAINRCTLEDTVILGHFIPKGTELLFLTGFTGLHTNKSSSSRTDPLQSVRSKTSCEHGLSSGLWDEDNALEFLPERWLVDFQVSDGSVVSKYSSKQGTSIPFGLGVRACFGIKLAVLELKLFIASITLAFFLDRVPESLNGFHVEEHLARMPKQSFICPRDW